MSRPRTASWFAVVLLLASLLAGCRHHQSRAVPTATATSMAQAVDTSTTSAIVPSTSPSTTPTTTSITATAVSPIGTIIPTPPARAYAAQPIQIPATYRDTFTHYATVDRTDSGGAVRVMYITPASIAAFQATGAFPIGTMVIMEVYRVQQTATGGFATDAAGHLIPSSLQSVLVKLKTGLNATPTASGIEATVNQRGWVYASFDATTGMVDGLDQPLCQSCHVRAQAWDDLFTRPELLAFAHSDMPQYLVCQLAGKQPCQEPAQ